MESRDPHQSSDDRPSDEPRMLGPPEDIFSMPTFFGRFHRDRKSELSDLKESTEILAIFRFKDQLARADLFAQVAQGKAAISELGLVTASREALASRDGRNLLAYWFGHYGDSLASLHEFETRLVELPDIDIAPMDELTAGLEEMIHILEDAIEEIAAESRE